MGAVMVNAKTVALAFRKKPDMFGSHLLKDSEREFYIARLKAAH